MMPRRGTRNVANAGGILCRVFFFHYLLLLLVGSIEALAPPTIRCHSAGTSLLHYRPSSSSIINSRQTTGHRCDSTQSRLRAVASASETATTNAPETTFLTAEEMAEEEEWLGDGFQPKTMSLPRSISFYAAFVVNYLRNNRLAKKLSPRNRQKLLRKLSRRKRRGKDVAVMEQLLQETLDTEQRKRELLGRDDDDEGGFRKTLANLNQTRKSLIALVGFDGQLLVPSFAFLLLGALMREGGGIHCGFGDCHYIVSSLYGISG
eukprot:scaffold79133_cov34-Attheya_sp.AAC.1